MDQRQVPAGIINSSLPPCYARHQDVRSGHLPDGFAETARRLDGDIDLHSLDATVAAGKAFTQLFWLEIAPGKKTRPAATSKSPILTSRALFNVILSISGDSCRADGDVWACQKWRTGAPGSARGILARDVAGGL